MVKSTASESKPSEAPSRERRTSGASAESLEQDLALMKRVAGGDRLAQRQVVIRLSGRVQRISYSLIRDSADTDDLVQATLLEILKSAHSFRATSSLERWSDRIVVRRAMRLLRKKRESTKRVDADFDLDELAMEPQEGGGMEDVAKPVEDYLQQLAEPLRTVLVLRHALEYSIQEIADLTSVSPNTTKKRLVRANQLFRRLVRRDRLGPSQAQASSPSGTFRGGGDRA